MPTRNVPIRSIVIAYWGLPGAATKGRPGYRSQNPWQALERFMEGNRGNGAAFFASHGANPSPVDTGGSVWQMDFTASKTHASKNLNQFAKELLDNLVQQNTIPHPEDFICVTYYDTSGGGRWEWKP